jgi:hypothetical protein
MATKLKEYIKQHDGVPFSWANNNCMSFVMGYLDLEIAPVSWFVGHENAKSCYKEYKKKAKQIGYESLTDVFDSFLQREITLHPRTGFVVAKPIGGLFGHLYGIHFMGFNLFLTEESGLQPFDVEHSDMYWSI